MIVNATDQGWDIIFQRTHALLAGKIAMHWQDKPSPERWVETLAAIIDHDDGQKDWRQGTHLTDAGAPMDYAIQVVELAQARRVVDNARYRSQWIALLTSMHTSALYERLRGQNSETDAFLDEQLSYQKKLQHSLKIGKKAAEATYNLMFLCDACSLILCKDEVPAGGRKLEIGHTPDQKSLFIYEKNANLYSVTPWPFEPHSFHLSVEVFQLEQMTFKDDQELYEALDQAKTFTKAWTFER